MKTIAFAVLFSASLFANVTISISGTFNSNAAVGTFSAPNAPWTLSFQLNQPPTVFGVMPNYSFDSTPLNVVYTLNGISIPATGTEVFFSNTVMNIFLDQSPVQFFVNTPTPFFTGPVSSPTLIVGSFPVTNVAVIYNQGTIYANTTSSNLVIAGPGGAPSTTPAPSSLILISLGLGVVAMLEVLRRKKSAA